MKIDQHNLMSYSLFLHCIGIVYKNKMGTKQSKQKKQKMQ